jgi:hypothetical protein
MLTVHQMPLNNQFLTGISFGYDKISDQNELQLVTRLGFTSDYLSDDCLKPYSNFENQKIVLLGIIHCYNTIK